MFIFNVPLSVHAPGRSHLHIFGKYQGIEINPRRFCFYLILLSAALHTLVKILDKLNRQTWNKSCKCNSDAAWRIVEDRQKLIDGSYS